MLTSRHLPTTTTTTHSIVRPSILQEHSLVCPPSTQRRPATRARVAVGVLGARSLPAFICECICERRVAIWLCVFRLGTSGGYSKLYLFLSFLPPLESRVKARKQVRLLRLESFPFSHACSYLHYPGRQLHSLPFASKDFVEVLLAELNSPVLQGFFQ